MSSRPSVLRRTARWSSLTIGGTILALVAVHEHVTWSAYGHVFAVDDAPTRDVILVLGASVRRDGRPSNMLAERIATAARLYHAGRGTKVLVSGDHGRRDPDYDEVSIMAREVEALGVPPSDIFLDHDGFRTLDSMYRARHVFDARSVLVVSNPFHVARAVFLGRAFGLDCDGVAAVEGTVYRGRTRFTHETREVLARILAWVEVCVLGTTPEELGPKIPLDGDGRATRVDPTRSGN